MAKKYKTLHPCQTGPQPHASDDPNCHSQQCIGDSPGKQGGVRCWVVRSCSRSPATASRATSRASCAASSRRCSTAEAEVGVHSAKDLPAELPEGLSIAAVPAREDPADAWIGPGASLDDVPEGATGRHGQPAPARPAARRPSRPGGARTARQRRYPPRQARRGGAGRDRARRGRPAPAWARERGVLRDRRPSR